jgi:hypothetical protein
MDIKFLIIIIILLVLPKTVMAQNTTKIIGEKNETLIDSLEITPYGYVLPLLGANVRKKDSTCFSEHFYQEVEENE